MFGGEGRGGMVEGELLHLVPAPESGGGRRMICLTKTDAVCIES
jgi:hypothetical protein